MCCMVCLEWENGKLTSKEALRNLGELIELEDDTSSEMQHYFEVADQIIESDLPSIDQDQDLLSLDSDELETDEDDQGC